MKIELLQVVRVLEGQNKGTGDDGGKRYPCRSVVVVVQESLPEKQVFQKELQAGCRHAKFGVFDQGLDR